MMKIFDNIYDDFDYKRNIRIKFRTLIMKIQNNFQSFFFTFFIFEQSNRLRRNSKNWEVIRKVFTFVKKNVEFLFISIRYFDRSQNRTYANVQSYLRECTTIKKKLKKKLKKNRTTTIFWFYLCHCFCDFDIDIVYEIYYFDAFCETYDLCSLIYWIQKSWFYYWHVDFHEQMFHLRRVETYVKILFQRAKIQETSMT